MKNTRRDFLKLTGMVGIGLAGGDIMHASANKTKSKRKYNKVLVDHVLVTLEDGSLLATPFWLVDSGKDGPSLLLIASQHGNEVQGAEVARRFKEICARQLVAGSVWLLPMADLRAVRSRRYTVESLPEQRVADKNMQRTWPGNLEGHDTERVAYALDQAVVSHCSHGVDMHCWNHFWAAETLSETDNEPSHMLGEITTTRFISYRSTQIPKTGFMNLRQLFHKRGRGVTVIELSGQYQMQERQVQIGLSSMVNIAKKLGIIEGEPKLIKGQRAIRNNETSNEVHAPCSGIFMPALKKDKFATLIPEDYIFEGQLLGHIIREHDLETVPIIAPVSGYLWQFGMCHWSLCDASLPAQHPYAEENDIIALIVTV